jgi:outer membrane protein, multidrug efflux system
MKIKCLKQTCFLSLFCTICLALGSCAPSIKLKKTELKTPSTFTGSKENSNSANINWHNFFKDKKLVSLVDIALTNNQELNIFLQDLEIAKNEVGSRSGAYLPFLDFGASAGLDKVGEYTRLGALEENLDIAPNKRFPDPLTNYSLGLRASWEVDIWQRLRNAQKSALTRFISSQEGRNFMLTNLIAEVANTYYELLALDSQLAIVKQNVEIQRNALETVRLEKQGARLTELAVRRFEAQLLKTESLQYDIQQHIFTTENRINFLLGRFPQTVARSSGEFITNVPKIVKAGVPSQLLKNRPDIRQAALNITAAELDIKVAEAAFYPSLNISADIGYEAYRLGKVVKTPESLLYSLGGSLTGPLINRRAITAEFYSANARQIQSVFNYERVVLNAFIEAANQISNIKNLETNVALRRKQVSALTSSINIANTLFNSARADYTEVLLTQRDAIESKFEFIEAKMKQMQAVVNLYRTLGGGWRK